ncbi:MAG: Gfo/Idh/MocA family oxidoreductase [Oscillatoriales cyanobacterium RM2_1_1]|nr:Gfo/Idh/MocA family oxidoreductase [Oscillatoriales cyanobacterium SM2_3_0]NJO47727.1 Gfo/Idh/MocA family oxidoreductase [Oscillatoriales cyanobacterium RM2_1_1]
MTNSVRVAIFGAGRWGNHLIRNFFSHPQAEIVGIADPNLERLEAIQAKLKLPTSVKLATDWTTVMNLPGLEAVVIVTPASTHYSLISDALQRGYHVFVEKPLTLKYSDSLELCHLAEQCDRRLFVDHTYLFNPAVNQGRAIVQGKTLGELRYGYATRTHLEPVRQDVDALWDLAIHDICIFNHWLGQMPTQVQATGTVWLQPQTPLKVGHPQDLDDEIILPGLADFILATLTYGNGFRAFIHLCWLNPDKQRRLAVVGNQGTLIFDELLPDTLTLQRGSVKPISPGWRGTGQNREVIHVPAGEPLAQVCDHFLNCVIRNQSSPISSGYFGAELVRVLCGLSQSLAQGSALIHL